LIISCLLQQTKHLFKKAGSLKNEKISIANHDNTACNNNDHGRLVERGKGTT
jgi:hypothetical protein